MIPDYKLYHGAVLADIVDRARGPVIVEEVHEEGRLLNYVLNRRLGLQIRFSTQRIRPWAFTFTPQHVQSLQNLKDTFGAAFLALVCGQDGFVTIEANDVLPSLLGTGERQSWLRVDRRRRELYKIAGSLGDFPRKYPTTTEAIVEAFESDSLEDLNDLLLHPASKSLAG